MIMFNVFIVSQYGLALVESCGNVRRVPEPRFLLSGVWDVMQDLTAEHYFIINTVHVCISST